MRARAALYPRAPRAHTQGASHSCTTVAYVHYPTISTDMLALVYDQRPQYNNDVRITSSKLRSTIKLLVSAHGTPRARARAR